MLPSIIFDSSILATYTTRIDRPTFDITFIPKYRNCLFSIKLELSKANDDIVVKEPQNPMATRKEYFESKFMEEDKTEKIPKIKLPITLTANIFEIAFPKI